MIALLSPAKTLDYERPLPPVDATVPRFAAEASTLAAAAANLSQKRLAELMDISTKLAKLNADRFVGFDAQPERPALYAFAGDVYLGFEARTLDEPGVYFAQDHVRMLSGLYGLLRVLLPIFPEQMWWVQTPLLWLAVASVVMSAFAALAQTDLKRMLGYLSISHLGYCTLAVVAAARITPGDAHWVSEKSAALSGAMLQMFNHGLIAATFFGLVGWLEDRNGGTRALSGFGGWGKSAPMFCGAMGVVMFASVGLPGLSGFVGEFLIFKGVVALAPWAAALSSAGLLVTAVFLLNFAQKVWHGPLSARGEGVSDLSLRERWIVAPSLILIFALGLYPQVALRIVNATVSGLVEQLGI
ncbi:MAG: peroxide stress protein YaaA [Verrucomicrobia bacterium]|nr:peroxide stress protein YaaA [Verrucomicrobiota bacterium]